MRHMDDLYAELGKLVGLDKVQASSDKAVLVKAIETIRTRDAEVKATLGILGDVRDALAVPDDVNIIHYARELRANVDALAAEAAGLRQQVTDWSAAVAEISGAALEMAKELDGLRMRYPVVVLRAERLDGGE